MPRADANEGYNKEGALDNVLDVGLTVFLVVYIYRKLVVKTRPKVEGATTQWEIKPHSYLTLLHPLVAIRDGYVFRVIQTAGTVQYYSAIIDGGSMRFTCNQG